jgi:nicotinate-nucleotide pyrophosphorylase (carboxylating)
MASASITGLESSDLVALALTEDLGVSPKRNDSLCKGWNCWDSDGDVTSRAFIPADSRAHARIIARSPCIASGLATAEEVFRRIDPALEISLKCHEGERLERDEVLLEIRGSTRSILSAERTALNFLGRLCGIATLARRYADAVEGTRVQLLDTRKTTPGWRLLEKEAVRAGGCVNHRMGLYDAVLVKDNHLAALGDLALLPPVIERLRREHPGLPIEIEADTLDQVERLLGMTGIDMILLDNMGCDLMRRAVALRNAMAPQVLLEASGGVTLESIGAIAKTGVDRISVGALTHSSTNADLSLELG